MIKKADIELKIKEYELKRRICPSFFFNPLTYALNYFTDDTTFYTELKALISNMGDILKKEEVENLRSFICKYNYLTCPALDGTTYPIYFTSYQYKLHQAVSNLLPKKQIGDNRSQGLIIRRDKESTKCEVKEPAIGVR